MWGYNCLIELLVLDKAYLHKKKYKKIIVFILFIIFYNQIRRHSFLLNASFSKWSLSQINCPQLLYEKSYWTCEWLSIKKIYILAYKKIAAMNWSIKAQNFSDWQKKLQVSDSCCFKAHNVSFLV